MNLGRTVFSQVWDFIPTYQFQICVDRYQGNRYGKGFSCWDQFLCLAFARLPSRDSLRDIEACLRAQQAKLYHRGFRGQVSRNPLARANAVRDWRIYRDFAPGLIGIARDLYREEVFGVELAETVYAFDSTPIDLCRSLFPWGQFRRRKSAVKLHTRLDVRGSIPTSVYVTGGQVHDVHLRDELRLEAGAFYLRDRGYVDFARLHIFTQACAFFIPRAKKNMPFDRRSSRPVDRSTGVRCDQTILLDQAAPAHQGFLGDLRERGEDSSWGCPRGLRPRGHRQKATGSGPEPLQNSPNSEHYDFRKNPNIRAVFQLR